MSTAPVLRRAAGRAYVRTHDRFEPLGTHALRSCGKCGQHVPNVGGSRHAVLGWIGNCCTPRAGSLKP